MESLKIKKNFDQYRNSGRFAEFIINDLYNIFGEDMEYDIGYLPLHLAKNAVNAPLKPKFYATCGMEDDLIKENRRFDAEMKALPFDWTYEEWTGRHEWDFFNEALKKSLEKWLG